MNGGTSPCCRENEHSSMEPSGTLNVAFRERQIQEDMARWSSRTRDLIAKGDENAVKVFGCYRNSVFQGDFDQIHNFVDPDKVSVDVGTNHGQYALKLAAISKFCLCIEPVKALRFVGEVLPDNCVFKNIAAGKARGESILRIPAQNGVVNFALSTMASDNPLCGYHCEEQITEVVPLDEILQETFPEEPIGYIKIDVEGLEDEVLEGSVETLSKYRPNLEVELHGDSGVRSLCQYLDTQGYRGIFFYKNRLFDASCFDPAVHRAPQNEWFSRNSQGLMFDSSLYVANFFFVSIRR